MKNCFGKSLLQWAFENQQHQKYSPITGYILTLGKEHCPNYTYQPCEYQQSRKHQRDENDHHESNKKSKKNPLEEAVNGNETVQVVLDTITNNDDVNILVELLNSIPQTTTEDETIKTIRMLVENGATLEALREIFNTKLENNK